jgi:hypothetical protein
MRCTVGILFAGLMLTGCQNAGYIMKTYNPVKKVVYSSPTGNWWVFDRPDLGKIMTTPTAGQIAPAAAISGVTVGLVKLDPLVQAHQAIAQKHFAATGRKCTIKTSSEIWRPEFEHTYTCS